MVILYILLSVLFVSLISLVGIATLILQKNVLEKSMLCLVSFAVGGLLGGAFIHLIPESIEEINNVMLVSMLILSGIILFFVFEKFVLWRHCHVPTSEEHPHPIVFMNIVGDGVHNFFDGVAIAASYLASIPIGIATTIAVILHEIPQELSDFGILVHGKLSYKNALLLNFLTALTAVIGAIVTIFIGAEIQKNIIMLLPITAGGFIYMATADLIPTLHGQKDYPKAWLQLIFVLLGIFLFFFLKH